MTSGIYSITNIVNGKMYIGLSSNVDRRWIEHITALKNGNHTNTHLQGDVDRYGMDNFRFDLIEEESDHTKLREREYFYISQYDPSALYNRDRKMKVQSICEPSISVIHYRLGAWAINVRRRNSMRKKAMYTGNLQSTAKRLLTLVDEQERGQHTEVQELIKAIDVAQKNVIESLKALTIERKSE